MMHERNQRVLIEDAKGTRMRFHYDARGNLERVVQGNEGSLEFSYDHPGRLKEISVAGCIKAKNTYSEDGQLIATEDGCGNKREIKYNDRGLPGEITRPDGSWLQLDYDARGNLSGLQSDGTAVRMDYDALNRFTSITDPLGNKTGYEYDDKNRIRRIQDAQGRYREFRYDGEDHLVSFRDFDGETVEYRYNEIGKLAGIIDKEGNKTEIFYNSMWE